MSGRNPRINSCASAAQWIEVLVSVAQSVTALELWEASNAKWQKRMTAAYD